MYFGYRFFTGGYDFCTLRNCPLIFLPNPFVTFGRSDALKSSDRARSYLLAPDRGIEMQDLAGSKWDVNIYKRYQFIG